MTDAPGLEVELKLDVDADALDDLLAAPPLAGMTFAREALAATYHDTPDRTLEEAGLSLRVRRSGDAFVQTVKASGAATAGLFARPEWEREVADGTPVLDASAGPLTSLIPPAALAAIGPAFTVEVTRRKAVVKEGDAEIEMVVDEGAITAGDARAPVVEIELELKAGPPAALFALARVLDEAVPLRLGVLSKSERGYRLLDGADAGAVKRAAAALVPAMTPAQAFQAIAAACLRQYRLNEALFLAHGQADALHQARVALRRLRSACSIFRGVVADDRADALRTELRWLSAVLGEARDLDVLLAREPGHEAERLGEARDAAYAALGEALRSRRARRLMIDLLEWTTTGAWLLGQPDEPGSADRFAAEMLDRLRRRIKRRGRKLARQGDEARHEIRILAKKLRYATEFFGQLFAGKKAKRRFKAFRAALEALQEALGELNDLATAPVVLTRLGLHPPAEADVAPRRKALLREAEDAYEALVDTKRFW